MYDNPQSFSGYPCKEYVPYRQEGSYGNHMMHHYGYKPEHKHHYKPYMSYPDYHSSYEGGQVKQMLAYLQPAINHCMCEVESKGTKHAVEEGALLGFLMGRGCDYQEALCLVESGEVHGMFKG